MTTLACLMHWYTSALYVVPVIAVGAWGWWSAKRASGGGDGKHDSSGGTDPSSVISDRPAY